MTAEESGVSEIIESLRDSLQTLVEAGAVSEDVLSEFDSTFPPADAKSAEESG